MVSVFAISAATAAAAVRMPGMAAWTVVPVLAGEVEAATGADRRF